MTIHAPPFDSGAPAPLAAPSRLRSSSRSSWVGGAAREHLDQPLFNFGGVAPSEEIRGTADGLVCQPPEAVGWQCRRRLSMAVLIYIRRAAYNGSVRVLVLSTFDGNVYGATSERVVLRERASIYITRSV